VSDKFVVVPFEHARHSVYVSRWLSSRSMDPSFSEELPPVGFIAFKGVPVAAAFFRRCDGKVGIFDSLVSNPDVALFTRHLAVEALIDRIQCYAAMRGYKRIMAFSVNDGTLKRSIKHGFKKQPHVVISKIL
jgi:hypothetical protein